MKHTHVVQAIVRLLIPAALVLGAGCASMGGSGTQPASQPMPGTPTGPAWESVANADSHEAFVDPASVKQVGNTVELRAKENFTTPQPAAKADRTYLSADNTYRFDCTARKVAFKAMRAYPEVDLQGKAVQSATFYDNNLQWMDAPADTVFGELLDYACDRAPAVPASGNPR